MISKHTTEAIIALLAVDPQASDDDRQRIVAAISGEGDGGALSVAGAARRIGVTRVTLYRLCKAGALTRLADGRVSEASVSRYLNNIRKVA